MKFLTFSLLILRFLFSAHSQLNFDKLAQVVICNQSDSLIEVEMHLIAPLLNKESIEQTTLIIGECFHTSYKLGTISKSKIRINSKSRLVHSIPGDTLLINYRGFENWSFPKFNNSYSTYSKDLIKGFNRLSSDYLIVYMDSLPNDIAKYEFNEVLYNGLEAHLRNLNLIDITHFRDSINNLYDLNDKASLTSQSYLSFLSSYYSSMFDELMNDTIPGYYNMSYFGKQIARNEYYEKKYEKELLTAENISDEIHNVNIEPTGINEYISIQEYNYWTFGLRKAKEILERSLFEALAYNYCRALILGRHNDAHHILRYIKLNINNMELVNNLESMYEEYGFK